MGNKELEELLEKNFSNVNSWLNFAEAKNAANIAFVVAVLAAIFSIDDECVLLHILCICLIISGMCSLFSFLPRLGNKVVRKVSLFSKNKKRKAKASNLIFFEDIKEYAGDTYIKQVCKKYFGKNKYNATKYQLDLADEIVYNSDIVSRKYKFFKVAVYLDIIAFLILVIYIACGAGTGVDIILFRFKKF